MGEVKNNNQQVMGVSKVGGGWQESAAAAVAAVAEAAVLENVQKAREKRRGKTRVSRGEVRHELFLMKRHHLKVS